MTTKTIGILGAGACGTALALAAAHAGNRVVLYARDAKLVQDINASRENKSYLSGIMLDPAISVVNDPELAAKADILLLVTPAQYLEAAISPLAHHVPLTTPLVICSKGIVIETGQLLADVVRAHFPSHAIGVLSGPSFARELAEGRPTAVTLAFDSVHQDIAAEVAEALGSGHFRLYRSGDVIGAEVAGAVKNVIAIACGIVAGREMGENTRAAVITRGLAEVRRLGEALGAQSETFMGLSGMGDLVLTCSAMQSRNFSFGYEVGQGRAVHEILAGRKAVTEGVHTARAVSKLAAKLGLDMPICESVNQVLNGGVALEASIKQLLARPVPREVV